MPTTTGRAARSIGAILVIAAALIVAACSAPAESPVSFDPNAPALTAANQQQFDKTTLAVPANAGFDLIFHNKDSAQHNVSIYSDEGRTQRVFGGQIANAGTHVYHVQALAPGTYYFQCDIHPAMKGTITAGG